MPQHFQVLNLSFHSSVHFRLVHLSKVDNLHGDFMSGQRVRCNCIERITRISMLDGFLYLHLAPEETLTLHFAETTDSQRRAEFILSYPHCLRVGW